jgi:hypothetical protein
MPKWKKFIILAAVNATILFRCTRLYFQGYEVWRVAVVAVVSVVGLNLLVEYMWRTSIKKQSQRSAKES